VWNFICQYGPPKEILTDNGGEFNNKLMSELLGKLNVKHQCSASYSPRTSGLIERFNYLFVESLRKVIDDEEGDWTDYVSFVLLAFRTKVHTTTKCTPYKLLFGREMNNFEKWDSVGEDCLECKDKIMETNCICFKKSLAKRAKELVRLTDEQQLALKNIEKRQEF
jgi:transposase InsO family protein